jgi:hypothetical protein
MATTTLKVPAAVPTAAALAIPVEPVSQDDLTLWHSLTQELERVKTAELVLRKKIFAGMFTNPHEGTNTVPLSQGWVLKGQYKINRTVDVAMLTTHAAMLHEKGVPVDELLKYKPELVTAGYRNITDEQRLLFDIVLDIKIGTPSLEIVLPKRAT